MAAAPASRVTAVCSLASSRRRRAVRQSDVLELRTESRGREATQPVRQAEREDRVSGCERWRIWLHETSDESVIRHDQAERTLSTGRRGVFYDISHRR